MRLRPSRRTVVRLVLRSIAVAGAVTLTVALAGQPSKSAFSASTGDGGNRITAAADFCTSSGPQTLIATEDTAGSEAAPSTPYGSYADIGAYSEVGYNARSLLRFSLPSRPMGCTLTGASLRLYANTVASGRVIQAWRADPSTPWTEAATTWATLPDGVAGTSVPLPSRAAVGWMEWPVTAIVTSHYAGTNSGFLVRDQTDSAAPPKRQLFDSRDSATTANRPQLVLTWG